MNRSCCLAAAVLSPARTTQPHDLGGGGGGGEFRGPAFPLRRGAGQPPNALMSPSHQTQAEGIHAALAHGGRTAKNLVVILPIIPWLIFLTAMSSVMLCAKQI